MRLSAEINGTVTDRADTSAPRVSQPLPHLVFDKHALILEILVCETLLKGMSHILKLNIPDFAHAGSMIIAFHSMIIVLLATGGACGAGAGGDGRYNNILSLNLIYRTLSRAISPH